MADGPLGDDRPGAASARDAVDRPVCGPGCACTIGNEFSEREVSEDLRRFRRSGPDRTTRLLLEGLSAGGVAGMTVLDIGAGIGAVHQQLLADGAARATDVEGSPAYLAAAQSEAARLGTADRVRYELGDFVAIAPSLEPADLVALDRVVCCYPDAEALVSLSVDLATRRYGLVYPRDTWWLRMGGAVLNAFADLLRRRTKAYIHRTADVEAILGRAGLTATFRRRTLVWQVVVFERATAAG